jgi:tetratricopeptide (TPR) repeat protein
LLDYTGAVTPPSTRDEAERLYYSALEHIAADRPNAAVAELNQALALQPAFLDAMHALVRALKDQGDYEAALAVALRLIALDPEDVLAYTALSILYQHRGMIPEAEAAALKAKLLGWKQQLAQARQP